MKPFLQHLAIVLGALITFPLLWALITLFLLDPRAAPLGG